MRGSPRSAEIRPLRARPRRSRRRARGLPLLALAWFASATTAPAMDRVRVETRSDEAEARYGLTGRGVVVAVLDRGLEIDHPDFRRADGTSRVLWLLDMSGQQGCDFPSGAGFPPAVEYSKAQLDAALAAGPPYPTRDAVGHGTLTAGAAAGNARGAAAGKYRGLAPEADLIIVKLTSEGAPAVGAEPAEPAFFGCRDEAFAWLAGKLALLGRPAVAIVNSGTQYGPIDGTSADSRLFETVFPADGPGRILVLPSGDEGNADNHAGGDFGTTPDTVVELVKASPATSYLTLWYSGAAPAFVTLELDDDGTVVGPASPGDVFLATGVELHHYAPGTEFWQSASGDHAAWIRIDGHAGSGRLRLGAIEPGASGRFDLYGDLLGPDLTPIVSFTDPLVPGRITDYASTASALVAGNHVGRDTYVDVDGILRLGSQEGAVGALWQKSSGGPTRDGRLGIDVTAPGQDLFAAVATRSFFGSLRFNLIQDGVGLYARFGGTSGSAPILTGAVALLLQSDPDLTADEARAALHAAARADAFTGAVPNPDWGFGKLDVAAALDLLDADDDGVANGVDVCPFTADPGQADTGGRGAASGPDGIGDACQCGDVNGDGRITLTDAVVLTRSLLAPPTATLVRPALCDVNASGTCSLADAAALRRAILSPPTATIAQSCAPARPR